METGMTDVWARPVAELKAGDVVEGGNRIWLTFGLAGGEDLTIVLPVDAARITGDELGRLVGVAHQQRATTDPTYRTPGTVEDVRLKNVTGYELGRDTVSGAVILIGRHPDGTATFLPIGRSDIGAVIESLQGALDTPAPVRPSSKH
jgi:hypothetical protein